MAGFLKKIFSFGKQEPADERIDETAPLPPIKWDALDALKPASEQALPEITPDTPEIQPEPQPVEVPAPLGGGPEAVATASSVSAPSAEIPPPIRQPAPFEPQAVLAEIAPEPQAVALPEPRPAPGKVTV